MSDRIKQMVWDRGGVSRTEKVVLYELAGWAHDNGENIWPAVETIASDCLLSDRTVQRVLKRLCERGLLELQAEARQHQPRLYRINLEALAALPLTKAGELHAKRSWRHPRGDIGGVRGDICDTRGDIRDKSGPTRGAPGVTPCRPSKLDKTRKPEDPPLGSPPEGPTGSVDARQSGYLPLPIEPEPSATKQPGERRNGSRLPSNWQLPTSWLTWALGQPFGFDEDQVRTEAEKFRDYWLGKAGKDALKVDWEATWRNWMRKAHEFQRQRRNRGSRETPGADKERRRAGLGRAAARRLDARP